MTKTPPPAAHSTTTAKATLAATHGTRPLQRRGASNRSRSFAETLRQPSPRAASKTRPATPPPLGSHATNRPRPNEEVSPERERERPEEPGPSPARREPEPLPEDGLLHLPPPIVLTPPCSVPAVAGGNPAWERAEAAALAEQVLSHVRVGTDGEVRLGLGGIFAGAEVRLRLEEGRVVPTLITDDPLAVGGLATRLEQELAARGLDAEPIRIECS